jgi:hypothetical protein
VKEKTVSILIFAGEELCDDLILFSAKIDPIRPTEYGNEIGNLLFHTQMWVFVLVWVMEEVSVQVTIEEVRILRLSVALSTR